METSTHNIWIIEQEGKYLQYYDERWGCYLFPNNKPKVVPYQEEISQQIINKYQIHEFILRFIGSYIHTKYCVPEQRDKEYLHYFYLIRTNSNLNTDNNEKWFTKEELYNNNKCMEINKDIIDKSFELLDTYNSNIYKGE